MTREEKTRNEYIRGNVGVVPTENILRWLGHVLRREQTEAVRLVKKINAEGRVGKRKTEKEVFGCD